VAVYPRRRLFFKGSCGFSSPSVERLEFPLLPFQGQILSAFPRGGESAGALEFLKPAGFSEGLSSPDLFFQVFDYT